MSGRACRISSIASTVYPQPPSVAAPGPSASVATSGLIFRPNGGATGPNVYTTLAALQAAIATMAEGPKTIVFDGNGSPIVMPAGTFDFGPDVSWVSYNDTEVDFSQGTTITTPPVSIDGLTLVTNQTPDVFSGGAHKITIGPRGSTFSSAGGSGFLFGPGTFTLDLYGTSVLATGSQSFVSSSTNLTINMFDGSSVESGSVTGAGTLEIFLYSNSASVSSTYDSFIQATAGGTPNLLTAPKPGPGDPAVSGDSVALAVVLERRGSGKFLVTAGALYTLTVVPAILRAQFLSFAQDIDPSNFVFDGSVISVPGILGWTSAGGMTSDTAVVSSAAVLNPLPTTSPNFVGTSFIFDLSSYASPGSLVAFQFDIDDDGGGDGTIVVQNFARGYISAVEL